MDVSQQMSPRTEPSNTVRAKARRWCLVILGMGALLAATPIAGAASPTVQWQGAIEWQATTVLAFDGSPLAGEQGMITVPVHYDRPDGPSLTLAFVRFRTTHPTPGPPIFFLAGGPGGSGIEGAAVVATHPQIRLLEHRDVIGLDQRGTGQSVPNLFDFDGTITLPVGQPLDRAALIRALERSARGTAEHWRREGVDLAAFTTAASADDLELLRQALELDQVLLYGASYGSHLGLAYLRRHGEHVERAVLSKVEGPDHTWKLPSTVDRHLEALHQRLAQGPSDAGRLDVRGTLRQLLDSLAEQPVWVHEDSETAPVAIGPLDLQIRVSRALATAGEIAELPSLLTRLAAGDWSDLAAEARDTRQVGVSAMPLMMDCASGATAPRWQQLDAERNDPQFPLADAILAPFYPEACAAAGAPDLGDDFRSPFASPVPVLLVSGTLDVRTPPSNVEALLPGFEQGVHVVVENAGHASRELMSPEYRGLLQAFLRGEPVEGTTITLPVPIPRPASAESVE